MSKVLNKNYLLCSEDEKVIKHNEDNIRALSRYAVIEYLDMTNEELVEKITKVCKAYYYSYIARIETNGKVARIILQNDKEVIELPLEKESKK